MILWYTLDQPILCTDCCVMHACVVPNSTARVLQPVVVPSLLDKQGPTYLLQDCDHVLFVLRSFGFMDIEEIIVMIVHKYSIF